MKPFDLERAKAGDPVVCRAGWPARIICFDRLCDRYNIVALITTYWQAKEKFVESVEVYRNDGVYRADGVFSEFDLMMS